MLVSALRMDCDCLRVFCAVARSVAFEVCRYTAIECLVLAPVILLVKCRAAIYQTLQMNFVVIVRSTADAAAVAAEL